MDLPRQGDDILGAGENDTSINESVRSKHLISPRVRFISAGYRRSLGGQSLSFHEQSFPGVLFRRNSIVRQIPPSPILTDQRIPF